MKFIKRLIASFAVVSLLIVGGSFYYNYRQNQNQNTVKISQTQQLKRLDCVETCVKPEKDGAYRIYVEDSAHNTDTLVDAIDAAGIWEKDTGVKMRTVDNKKDANVIVEVSNKVDKKHNKSGETAQLGATLTKTYDGELAGDKAKVVINREAIDLCEADQLTIMEHEFGHVLGLSHAKNKRDIMYYLQEDDQKITKRDIDGVKAIHKVLMEKHN